MKMISKLFMRGLMVLGFSMIILNRTGEVYAGGKDGNSELPQIQSSLTQKTTSPSPTSASSPASPTSGPTSTSSSGSTATSAGTTTQPSTATKTSIATTSPSLTSPTINWTTLGQTTKTPTLFTNYKYSTNMGNFYNTGFYYNNSGFPSFKYQPSLRERVISYLSQLTDPWKRSLANCLSEIYSYIRRGIGLDPDDGRYPRIAYLQKEIQRLSEHFANKQESSLANVIRPSETYRENDKTYYGVTFEQNADPEACIRLLEAKAAALGLSIETRDLYKSDPHNIVVVMEGNSSRDIQCFGALQDSCKPVKVKAGALVKAAQLTINDPYMQSDSTRLMNTGDAWAFNNMQFHEAWQQMELSVGNWGPTVKVALIDTGVDYNHRDLIDNMSECSDRDGWLGCPDGLGYNFVESNDNPMDDSGHGTHLAGIIGAVVNNGLDIAGGAPSSKIVPFKVLDAEGEGHHLNVISALDAALHAPQGPIDVILLAFTMQGTPEEFPEIEALLKQAHDQGVIVIAAAGNNGEDMAHTYPANSSYVITVGAVEHNNQVADYSNYGRIDAVVPGGSRDLPDDPNAYRDVANILSLLSETHTVSDVFQPMMVEGDDLVRTAGTSQAAAYTAAVAALVKSARQDMNQEKMRQLLRHASDYQNPKSEETYDRHQGYGRLNALNAVQGPDPSCGVRILSPFDGKVMFFRPDEEMDILITGTAFCTAGTADPVILEYRTWTDTDHGAWQEIANSLPQGEWEHHWVVNPPVFGELELRMRVSEAEDRIRIRVESMDPDVSWVMDLAQGNPSDEEAPVDLSSLSTLAVNRQGDVVAATPDGRIYRIGEDGSIVTSMDIQGSLASDLLLGYVSHRFSNQDIIAINEDDWMYAFDANGISLTDTWPVRIQYTDNPDLDISGFQKRHVLSTADVDQNGTNEMIVHTIITDPQFRGPAGHSFINIFNQDGSLVRAFFTTQVDQRIPANANMAVSNFDDDPQPEVALTVYDQGKAMAGQSPLKVLIYDLSNGNLRHEITLDPGLNLDTESIPSVSNMVIADFNPIFDLSFEYPQGDPRDRSDDWAVAWTLAKSGGEKETRVYVGIQVDFGDPYRVKSHSLDSGDRDVKEVSLSAADLIGDNFDGSEIAAVLNYSNNESSVYVMNILPSDEVAFLSRNPAGTPLGHLENQIGLLQLTKVRFRVDGGPWIDKIDFMERISQAVIADINGDAQVSLINGVPHGAKKEELIISGNNQVFVLVNTDSLTELLVDGSDRSKMRLNLIGPRRLPVVGSTEATPAFSVLGDLDGPHGVFLAYDGTLSTLSLEGIWNPLAADWMHPRGKRFNSALTERDLFKRGDDNQDGRLDISDSISILASLFLGAPLSPCRDAADANDDGGVDLSDSVLILGYLFLGSSAPPAPFPAMGFDPTDDSQGCIGF